MAPAGVSGACAVAGAAARKTGNARKKKRMPMTKGGEMKHHIYYRKNAPLCITRLIESPRRLPDKVAAAVDVADPAIDLDHCDAVVEIPCAVESWLDDDIAVAVDVAPLIADLDAGESAGEIPGPVEARLDINRPIGSSKPEPAVGAQRSDE